MDGMMRLAQALEAKRRSRRAKLANPRAYPKRGAEDDASVTYERGRTGGTVRAPANRMVSGTTGTYKGEGGDAVTQRPRASIGKPAVRKRDQAGYSKAKRY